MEVLITTKRFPPEAPSTAVLGKELAEELTKAGHQVTVAAGYPQHPYGRLFPGYQQKLLRVEQINGYRLVRCGHFIHPSHTTAVRALVMATQCSSYLLGALLAPRPQVVISFDGYPIMGPLISTLIARFSGAKLVTVIYDLYPDIAVEIGKLTRPHLITLARKLETLVYRSSDQIVVLSEGFYRTLVIDRDVDQKKVAVIPVWLDGQEITPLPRINPWRREMEIPDDKFVVLYAGTIGLVSGVEVVVEAALKLMDHPEILILLVGDGYGKEQVMAQTKALRLSNIRFLPFQPRERLSELQATSDVSLVTLAPGRGRTSVPSKVIGYMAAARPVIASVDGDCDTAALIREAGCGHVIPPGDGAALTRAIIASSCHPSENNAAGTRGREYFLNHFEKKTVIKGYLDMLSTLINKPDFKDAMASSKGTTNPRR